MIDVKNLLIYCNVHEIASKNKLTIDDRGEHVKFVIHFNAIDKGHSFKSFWDGYSIIVYENGVLLKGPNVSIDWIDPGFKPGFKTVDEGIDTINSFINIIRNILDSHDTVMYPETLYFTREFEPMVHYSIEELAKIINSAYNPEVTDDAQ